MAKLLDYSLQVSAFVLQLPHINSPYFSSYDLNSITAALYKEGYAIVLTMKVDMPLKSKESLETVISFQVIIIIMSRYQHGYP